MNRLQESIPTLVQSSLSILKLVDSAHDVYKNKYSTHGLLCLFLTFKKNSYKLEIENKQ